MRFYDSDQEQSEVLENFWQRHNRKLALALVLVFSGLWGFNTWYKNQITHRQEASYVYQELLDLTTDKKMELARNKAKQLISSFPKTPYADFAKLMLAKFSMENGQPNQAIKHYQSILAAPNHQAIKAVTACRLAQLYLEMHHPRLALQLIDQQPQQLFTSRYNELKGDAYVQLNDKDKAFQLYQAAKDAMPHDHDWHLALQRLELKQSTLYSHRLVQPKHHHSGTS